MKGLKWYHHFGIWFVIISAIFAVFIGFTALMFHHFPGNSVDGTSNRGTFGDMFGAVNALFSTLAFAGFIYTIVLQRSDLTLQRTVQQDQMKELELQRDEAARSADQLYAQRQLMNLQRIESIYYQLIKYLDDSIVQFSIHSGLNGRNFFSVGLITYNNILDGGKTEYEAIKNASGSLSDEVDKYFRTFLYALQFVVDADIEADNKAVFAELLNIRLIDDELRYLFLYVLNIDQQVYQHRLLLLNYFGFVKRYNNLEENRGKPLNIEVMEENA